MQSSSRIQLQRPCRRRQLLLASLAVLFLATACGETSLSPDEHVVRAQQARAEGDLRTALIEIKNALQQEPSRPEARRLLGEYNLALGNAVEAEAELLRAQELGSDPDRLRLPLLRASQMQGEHEQVIKATETSEPFTAAQWPDALILRGQALLSEGQQDAARDALKQALQLRPADAEALLGLAWAAWLGQEPAAARSHLQAALESDPQFARAWELQGDIEREAGQLEEAEASYSKAMDATKEPFSPRLKRALTKILQQDYAAAEQDVQALEKQAVEQPAVNYLRGLMAFNQEEYSDARTAFEDALARDPDYLPAMFYLGTAQYRLENWEQAERYLTRFVRRAPDSPEANRLLALTRLQVGDNERAEQALKAGLANNPEDSATLAMMSNLYLSQGRADEALHHLRQVIALEPESATSRAQLGVALVQEGQREEGFSELERALELEPEGSARLELAMILERLRAQEFEQALTLIERLREREDVNPALYYTLKGLAYVGQGKTSAAEAVFRDGMQAVPDAKPELVSNLVVILARDGRLDEARKLASETLDAFPEHLGLLTNTARLSAADGDAEQTEVLLERTVAAHPDALRAVAGLAEFYLNDDRPEQALAVLRDAEARHGQAAEWQRLMAVGLLRTGEREASVEVLKRLRSQQPEAADVYFTLGRVLAELGEVAEARATLEEGLALQPDHLGARLAAVQLLIVENKPGQARNMLEPAQRAEPNNPEVLRQAALIAAAQQRYADASAILERALELQPGDRGFTGALAQAQWREGDHEAAMATMKGWLAEHPGDDALRLLLANAQVERGQNAEAQSNFRQILKSQPDNVLALNNLAWLLREQTPEEALRYAEKAAELAPQAGAVRDTLGVILLQQGAHARAVIELREAVKLSDNAPGIRLNLAKALVAQGEIDAAKAELRQVLQQHPDFRDQDQVQQLLEEL